MFPIQNKGGTKMESRTFDSNETYPTTGSGQLHIIIWPSVAIEGVTPPQIEVWTDRGKSCVMQGPRAVEFINWVASFAKDDAAVEK
jgi:hypothetical protein